MTVASEINILAFILNRNTIRKHSAGDSDAMRSRSPLGPPEFHAVEYLGEVSNLRPAHLTSRNILQSHPVGIICSAADGSDGEASVVSPDRLPLIDYTCPFCWPRISTNWPRIKLEGRN